MVNNIYIKQELFLYLYAKILIGFFENKYLL